MLYYLILCLLIKFCFPSSPIFRTMAFPSTIRFSTFVRIACPAFLLSLIIITFSLVTMNLMFTMYKEAKAFRYPSSAAETRPRSNMDSKTLERLVLEKKILQSKLNRLMDSGYLNYLRQRNHNLAKKLFTCEVKKCPAEKSIQQNPVKRDEKIVFDGKAIPNVTVNREFFDYLVTSLRDTPYPGVDDYTRYTVARLGLAPLVGVEPLIPEFGPVINDVLSFTCPISIPPCQDHVITGAGRTVFVAVISAIDNFSIRKIIRQTWKNHLKEVHQEGLLGVGGFAFVLGLTEDQETQNEIEKEAKTYGDIIQIDIPDSYGNLSLKTTGLFNWLYRYCAKVDFVLKVDDDVYVNVRNLAHFVQIFHRSNQSMFGLSSPHPYFWPQREGKWSISFEDWPWNTYPPSYEGPIVLFPNSVIFPILAAMQTTPLMPFEDVYYTGLCREKAGIKIHLYTNSTISRVGTSEMSSNPSPCEIRRFVAWVMHELETEKRMKSSHVATDDFYHNRTRCKIIDKNGNNSSRAINPSDPVQFSFV